MGWHYDHYCCCFYSINRFFKFSVTFLIVFVDIFCCYFEMHDVLRCVWMCVCGCVCDFACKITLVCLKYDIHLWKIMSYSFERLNHVITIDNERKKRAYNQLIVTTACLTNTEPCIVLAS